MTTERYAVLRRHADRYVERVTTASGRSRPRAVLRPEEEAFVVLWLDEALAALAPHLTEETTT